MKGLGENFFKLVSLPLNFHYVIFDIFSFVIVRGFEIWNPVRIRHRLARQGSVHARTPPESDPRWEIGADPFRIRKCAI